MDNNQDRDICIHLCTFQVKVQAASVLIKFPCQYFLEWKTANGKKVVQGKSRPTARNNLVEFNQALEMVTEMVYDNPTKQFIKKDTVLNLNLISKSRQDQVKLIGRVNIDLAEVANKQEYMHPKAYKLSYCSVDAQLTFSAGLTAKRTSNMNLQDLDRSSFKQDWKLFSDYFSFYSCASSPKEGRLRKDFDKNEFQETSIGYAKTQQENVIDMHHDRHSKTFNQTFFMLNSPVVNRNRQGLKKASEKTIESERNSNIRSDFINRELHGNKDISNSRSTQLTNLLNTRGKFDESQRQEDPNVWQQEKKKFRGEIDGNREKIQELQRKITELCLNLEDSKRHLEITERQNREKEEIIKHLKQSQDSQGYKKRIEQDYEQSNTRKQYIELDSKLERLNRDRQNQSNQWKAKQEIYKSQIQQFQSSIDLLRRQTEDFRKIWQQKKDHYQEKIASSQAHLKQKQQKLAELNSKIEEILKYKYQYEILKELNEEKDEKLKNAEKSLNGLKFQIEQINKNNYAEEIYKLKLQIAQSTKNYEEVSSKYTRSQQEINKYKENYIKIQTAFEIQGKNYQNAKEKCSQNQSLIYTLQKQNIELKNNISNTLKNTEELNKAMLSLRSEHTLLQRSYEELQKQHAKIEEELRSIGKEREELQVMNERMRVQQQAKSRDFEEKVKKIETTIISAHEEKDRQHQAEKLQLQGNIAQLQSKQIEYQQKIEHLQANAAELKLTTEAELKAREATIASLESAIIDKQQIIKLYLSEIQALKESNEELSETLRQTISKQKQLEQNVLILQEQSHKILYILEQKQQLDKDYEQKLEEVNTLNHEIQSLKASLASTHDQLLESKSQLSHYKEITKQINDRYEQHLKLEEKYHHQITCLRQEKEELELLINKNSNEFARFNEELEERLNSMQQHAERLEMQCNAVEEQKRQLETRGMHLEDQLKRKESKIQELQKNIAELERKYNETKNTLQSQQEKATITNDLQHKINISEQTANKLSVELTKLKEELSKQTTENLQLKELLHHQNSSLQLVQAEKSHLNEHIEHLQNQIHQIETPSAYNQLIQINEQLEVQAAQSILEQRKVVDHQRYQELQQTLFESQQKIHSLEEKVEELNIEIRNLVYELQKKGNNNNNQTVYQDFPQFQKEEMTKIIDYQRKQIDSLEMELKLKTTKSSAALENRIRELQANIVELESSFRMEIDRILTGQPAKETLEGGLSVIHEESMDDDCFKSEKSIPSLLVSPNRVKASFDQAQLTEVKDKLQALQQQKKQIQELLEASEEEKFNLMSSINQKEIQLQEVQRLSLILATQNQDLKRVKQTAQAQLKALGAEIQSLRNQVNFGTSILLPNQQSITRSEPIISTQLENKDVEMEYLRAELEKYKQRQEELLWNAKELQMQLEMVMENLNLLNSSEMNNILNDNTNHNRQENSGFVIEDDGAYSKQKLLQNLKRNEELKEIAHNLIKTLKLKQQKHYTPIKNDTKPNSLTLQTFSSKLTPLFLAFQALKSQASHFHLNRLTHNQSSSSLLTSLLSFQQPLLELTLLLQSPE